MRPDFEYLAELLDGFFRQKRISRSLAIIEKREITGWEVWFQVEFAYYLDQCDSQPEWARERTVEFDRRMEKTRFRCRPDFIIRKKGWRQESYVALEVKQHPNVSTCIGNMMKDIAKIAKIRTSSLDIRSIWVLGIHRRAPKAEIRDLIETRLREEGLEPPGDYLIIKYIPGTNFAYSLF